MTMRTTTGEFSFPHCGAPYEVTIHRTPFMDQDTAECEVCRKTMNRWNTPVIPSYKLIEFPNESSLARVAFPNR